VKYFVLGDGQERAGREGLGITIPPRGSHNGRSARAGRTANSGVDGDRTTGSLFMTWKPGRDNAVVAPNAGALHQARIERDGAGHVEKKKKKAWLDVPQGSGNNERGASPDFSGPRGAQQVLREDPRLRPKRQGPDSLLQDAQRDSVPRSAA